jgi:DNA-binding CsgD family transcriptional regulator
VREPDVLPAFVRRELAAIRAGHLVRSDERWVRVPMSLEGRPIGSLSLNCGQVDLEPGDLSVLRILANQAGVSLHTAEQYRTGVALHHLAQRRYDEARPGQEPAVEVKRGSLPECTLTARRARSSGCWRRAAPTATSVVRLFISETTAKFHVGNILRKLGASSRAEAVYAASKLGAI